MWASPKFHSASSIGFGWLRPWQRKCNTFFYIYYLLIIPAAIKCSEKKLENKSRFGVEGKNISLSSTHKCWLLLFNWVVKWRIVFNYFDCDERAIFRNVESLFIWKINWNFQMEEMNLGKSVKLWCDWKLKSFAAHR